MECVIVRGMDELQSGVTGGQSILAEESEISEPRISRGLVPDGV